MQARDAVDELAAVLTHSIHAGQFDQSQVLTTYQRQGTHAQVSCADVPGPSAVLQSGCVARLNLPAQTIKNWTDLFQQYSSLLLHSGHHGQNSCKSMVN